MSDVQEAIDALRAALHKKGVQYHAREAFNHLASCVVLLNSSSPSVKMICKLCSVLRKPLLPLYNACLQPTLQLSSSILSTVLGKLCDHVEDDKLRSAWDETAEVILSGVLDFLDQEENIESDIAIWEALYRIICDFFFLDAGRTLPEFSTRLCLSAYNTLSETAARQANIGNALRDKAVLGGERLGAAISRTRDYLLLEALLMLFGRLLPPIHNTSQGKVRRAKFVKDVLGSSRLFKCNGELLDVMNKTSGTQWDDIAAQIVDALARSDITYPQPFSIDEIAVCGRVFPQPLATDRLIMDKQVFLVNIIAENDDPCESLQVSYTSIHTITVDTSGQDVPKGKVSITIYLTSPPLVADLEMKSPDASQLHARFLLQNDVVGRFMEALRRRGVGKLSFLNPPSRVQRQRKSVSIGSGVKFTNDSSPVPPTASFEGKVQHVTQVYKTDVEESAVPKAVSMPLVGDAVASSMSEPGLVLDDGRLIPEARKIAVAENVSTTFKIKLISPIKASSRPAQNPTLPFSGDDLIKAIRSFDSDSELSEISDFEPENDNKLRERIGTAISTSRDQGVKHTRRRIVRAQRNPGDSVAISAVGIEKVSNATSQTSGRTGGVTLQPLEAGESYSPTFGSSSTTHINVYPGPLPNTDTLLATAGTESAGGLSIVSQDLVSMNGLDGRGPVDTKLFGPLAGKHQTETTSTEHDIGQHSRLITSSYANRQKVHPSVDLTSVPPKVAGSRRKREIIKPSSKAVVELDDDSTPPRKKSRSSKIKEDSVKSNETPLDADSISGMKKHTKTANGRSTARQETRRSSRIKKRQPAETGGTRASTTRGTTQKLKKAGGQPIRMESKTAPPQDMGVKISSNTPLNPSFRSTLASNEDSNIDSHVTLVEIKSAEQVFQQAAMSQEALKTCTTREPTPLSVTPTKAFVSSNSNQRAASDETQFVRPRFDTKIEEGVDDRQIMCRFQATNDVGRDNGITAHSANSGEREDSVQPTRVAVPVQCTPPGRPEHATIDLTLSVSPDRGKNESHRVSISALVRPEVDHQTKFIKTSDQSDFISVENSPSPRRRRRSVTFASPIEYVLDKKIKSKKEANSSSNRFLLSPEGHSVSPITISSGTVNRVTSQMALGKTKLLQGHKTSVHDCVPDEIGIQDIVEVLDEIQAVIIRGISDKFRNVRKDAHQGREELIRQVLDELRGMVVENEKYLSALVCLEEDYYKGGKAIARCWEELIDSNDVAMTRSQHVLKEYGRNMSARTFPKSLLPPTPLFRRRHVNA